MIAEPERGGPVTSVGHVSEAPAPASKASSVRAAGSCRNSFLLLNSPQARDKMRAAVHE